MDVALVDILNSYQSKSLGGYSPRKVLLNLEETNPVNLVAHIPTNPATYSTIVSSETIIKLIDEVHEVVVNIHREVVESAETRRLQKQAARQKQIKLL